MRLADGAAGNPLYITELLAALARGSGLTVTESGAAELAGGSAPDSLSAAIADRLGFAAGPVREVLRAAALLGMDFAVPDLAVVLGRNVPDLIPAVDEARTAGVLAESGHGLGFRHPLIRAALYDEMPAPVRAAWHRDAGRALAEAGAPADRVARQMLRATAESGGAAEPVDEWMLDWLARSADPLVAQAPGVAADLLARAVASSPAGSPGHGWLASRLADALYRTGERAAAERVADRALARAEPDVLVDLQWTLAQCRMLAGESAESLATLDRALATPGISAGHRARLLVLAARTHSNLGEFETAGRVAASALAAAEEAGDNWAMGWALLLMAAMTSARGQMADALPLFDRALAATEAEPALSDLRLLLEINKAVTLGALDQYEQAFTAAGEARNLADQVGTAIRLAQAHSAVGELLFQTGRWDDALAEMELVPENLKTPTVACCNLGIAAVISFHRGETDAARRHLAAAGPHAERLGHRLIGPLALARSLDREQDGAPDRALAALTDGFGGNAEELEQIEDLLADAVRLGVETGDLQTAQTLAGQADELAAGSQIPHRQANALYCRGLLDHDASRLLEAAQRYDDASRPLLQAKALEAAAGQFVGTRRSRPGPGRVHQCRGGLHVTGRGGGRRPAPGRVPGPRHPARAARQAPAGAQRLGQPHRDRDEDRRVRGRGAVQSGDRRPAAAVAPDRRDARFPHPQEARRAFAHGYRARIRPAHPRAEVTGLPFCVGTVSWEGGLTAHSPHAGASRGPGTPREASSGWKARVKYTALPPGVREKPHSADRVATSIRPRPVSSSPAASCSTGRACDESWTSTRSRSREQLMTSVMVSPGSCATALVTSSLVSSTARSPSTQASQAQMAARTSLRAWAGAAGLAASRTWHSRKSAGRIAASMFIVFPHRRRGRQSWSLCPAASGAVRAVSPGLAVPVALQILLQLAVEDIGQLTDLRPYVAGDRFTVIRRGPGG